MDNLTYDEEVTALLVIDPYNDFISEGGKLWDRITSLPSRRLRDLEVHCSYSEGSLVKKDIRIRHLGRRDSQ